MVITCALAGESKKGDCAFFPSKQTTHTPPFPQEKCWSKAATTFSHLFFFARKENRLLRCVAKTTSKFPSRNSSFPHFFLREKRKKERKSPTAANISAHLSPPTTLRREEGESIREFAGTNFQLPPPPPPPHLPHPASVLFHFLFSLLRIRCSRKKNYRTTLSQETKAKICSKGFFGSLTLLLQRWENKECMFEQGRLLMFRMP